MSGIKYSQDKPKDCRYCYFWKNNKVGCELGSDNCFYRIKPKRAVSEVIWQNLRSWAMKLHGKLARTERLERANEQLTNLYNQQEATKGELGEPFSQEAELMAKSQRLAELDAALNMKDTVESRAEKKSTERPSVLADLKSKAEHIPPAKRSEAHEEVL